MPLNEKASCLNFEQVMSMGKNKYDLVYQCCDIMFTFKDSRFLLFILNNVPDIKSYLHMINPETSWLPLFRILNIFGSEFYFVNDSKRFETAQEILSALFRLGYDFLL